MITTSFTEENYLKAIFHLSPQEAEAVSTNAIAEALQTKAASVTDMLKKLADKNLINYVKYQGVTLTDIGQQAAINIIRKHRLWEVFLVDKLNFKWDEVHELAEDLEHINSTKLIDSLEVFLGFPKVDPHGDPIPDKNGVLKEPALVPVSKMNINQTGIISGVKEHSTLFLNYLEKAGLVLGKQVKVQDLIEFDGSVIIALDKQLLTISRDVAKNILIAV
ncbi:MAG: metal-dependent transcriptional regulator [Sphingobacteriales bacterium]|jgi:DtxR family Mn-dependent transcriptional regulator|nr:MAG: metal-dependent transcriptional regulator [Sphingobacteriales bacterium]